MAAAGAAMPDAAAEAAGAAAMAGAAAEAAGSATSAEDLSDYHTLLPKLVRWVELALYCAAPSPQNVLRVLVLYARPVQITDCAAGCLLPCYLLLPASPLPPHLHGTLCCFLCLASEPNCSMTTADRSCRRWCLAATAMWAAVCASRRWPWAAGWSASIARGGRGTCMATGWIKWSGCRWVDTWQIA